VLRLEKSMEVRLGWDRRRGVWAHGFIDQPSISQAILYGTAAVLSAHARVHWLSWCRPMSPAAR